MSSSVERHSSIYYSTVRINNAGTESKSMICTSESDGRRYRGGQPHKGIAYPVWVHTLWNVWVGYCCGRYTSNVPMISRTRITVSSFNVSPVYFPTKYESLASYPLKVNFPGFTNRILRIPDGEINQLKRATSQ